jgi:hypothetical protein
MRAQTIQVQVSTTVSFFASFQKASPCGWFFLFFFLLYLRFFTAMPALLLPLDISYTYKAKGHSAVISGSVTNGGPTVSKAFVAVVKIIDEEDQLIQGPYAGMSQSKLGAYRYIAGGAPAAQGKFSFKVGLPEGAAKIIVSFAPWDYSDHIQFAALPVVELLSGKKVAA